MNLLAYVHLRNIHNSTGSGRVARQILEHFIAFGKDRTEILADRADHQRILPLVGAPWDGLNYYLFDRDTSRQQAFWYLFNRPKAEDFWPDAQIMYCAAESYVPTRRIPLVVTLHDAAFFEPDAHQGRGVARQRFKWQLLYRTLSRRAAMFHTVSDFSAERLAHFFPAIKDRLRVVHNGVVPRFFAPPSAEGEAELARLGLVGKEFVFLHGGLHYRKNADLALATWSRLRAMPGGANRQLVIAGNNDPVYVEKAQSLADPTIRLLGRVDDETLCSLYHAARVFWSPSRYEGFGMTVLEAMACGTPVVTSNVSSLPEVAGDAAWLVPLDAEAQAAALLDLLDNEAARADLIARGHRRAAGFTWDAAAAKLRADFQSLL